MLQQPLDWGVDLVVHSATKYIAGHADLVMGAIVTRDDQLHDVLKGRRDLVGAIPGAFEAWLALRGLRTLPLRVERAQANAQELVRRLGERDDLTEVRYPGFGGMISIVLPSGEAADFAQHATGSGSTPPRSAGSSRPSSAGAAGSPSRPPSPTA